MIALATSGFFSRRLKNETWIGVEANCSPTPWFGVQKAIIAITVVTNIIIQLVSSSLSTVFGMLDKTESFVLCVPREGSECEPPITAELCTCVSNAVL